MLNTHVRSRGTARLFLFSFLLSVLAGSSAEAAPDAWAKLVHLRKGTIYGYQTDIDDDRFYFAKDRTPDAEFEATLTAFRASQITPSGRGDDRIECRFPARFQFLKRTVPEAKDWSMPACPRFDGFREGLRAKSATLVFSAYYLNNPSSAFGHTFLRLNRGTTQEKRHPLLDYGLGFAASAPDSDPVSFALGGLFGWFRGDFTSIPYYLKVQEYNDYESRDLWEYDLELSADEVKFLIEHLWELANVKISYKYLSKNCSSLMLTSLEAAAPRLELLSRVPYWVIPADTVRALYDVPGLVAGYQYRPSKRSLFRARFKSLNDAEREQVTALIQDRNSIEKTEALTGPRAGDILDALIDYNDFRYYKQLVRKDPETAERKQRLLVARSKLGPSGGPAVEPDEPLLEKPHLAHGSARSSAGMLFARSGERSYLVGQRFALHDLLDEQRGYPRDSEIDFLDFQLRILSRPSEGRSAESAVRFETGHLFAVKSFAPYERLVPNISWKVRLGFERTWDLSCRECLATVLGGGAGLTFDLYRGKVLATMLLSPDVSLSSEFERSAFKFRLGPEFNLRAILSSRLVFQANAQYFRLLLAKPDDAYRVSEEVRWALPTQNFALGAAVSHLPDGDVETRTQLYFYW